MNIRQYLAIMAIIALFFSSVFLNNLIDEEYNQMMTSSQPRLTALLIVHILLIMYIVVFMKI
jgi:hypothetical protein